MAATRAHILVCLGLLLLGTDARAQYAVVAPSGQPEVLGQRIAVSFTNPARVWLTLHLAEGTETGALVLAVAKDAEVRPADGAWFSALEGATAVRVLAPDEADSAACPLRDPAWHDTREVWPEAYATLEAIDRFESVEMFAAYGEEHGLELETSVVTKFESIPAESEIVALGFDCAADDPAGCIVSAHFEVSAPIEVVLPLLGSDDGVATTVWGFGPSALEVRVAQTASLTAVAPVNWYAAEAQSDYTSARSALLHDVRDALLLESATTETFGSGIIFDEERRIPSLVTSYEPGEFDELAAVPQGSEWLMRWFLYATPAVPELVLRRREQPSLWPVHRWAKLDATGCTSPPPRTAPPPMGNASPDGICDFCTPEPDPTHSHVSGGCSTSDTSQSSSSDSGCSGDTSESSGSDSGCSSDTSESSGSDSGCSGDTSEGSDSDSGCSSDTSESSSSDSGCSSDTSESSSSASGCSSDTSESSGSGCSGDSASSTGSGCSGDTAASASPRHRKRWRGSPMLSSFVACALMLPLRRLRRRKSCPRAPSTRYFE
ncbi:MAG TPA: hypothetical protein VM686_39800 [Polyangiaceae bacterium]|nr:hypothetical protein [Polyangiaceae bacterium]